jgi:hypothetical protein
MYEGRIEPRRFPKVPFDRRIGAFAIDFLTVWLISAFFGKALQWLIFLVGWAKARIVMVDRNEGQSLGSWAFDMKVLDVRLNRVPDLVTLGKREGTLGLAAMFAMYGLQINLTNGLSMLLLLTPLLVNCGFAFVDEDLNQALHDRIANTIIIQTKRGFSLDLRIKKIVAQIQKSMRKY